MARKPTRAREIIQAFVKDFLLKAEMPGFKSKDIEVNVLGNAIEIQAQTGWERDDKTKRYICNERGCESFYRMLQLPEEVKVDNVNAELKDGVLEVVMPKKKTKQRKKISVKYNKCALVLCLKTKAIFYCLFHQFLFCFACPRALLSSSVDRVVVADNRHCLF